MRKLNLILALLCVSSFAYAQEDSTKIETGRRNDTIRVGNILIIKRGSKKQGDDSTIVLSRKSHSNSKVSTNYFVFDFGFSNYNDQTDYTQTGAYLINSPAGLPFGKNDFKLRAGKSINVNIWFFMQRLSIIKNNVNLKYGLGLELNNYRYKSAISYSEGGSWPYGLGLTNAPFIFRDSISFSKNKLAADYLTVPLMINFATNDASSKKGVSVSFGVSAGYLYSQRNKQKSEARGKEKNKGEYDLEKFKLSYVGELGIGPVRLYGSYSPKSMYEHSLDMRPFNVGLRFSNW